MKTSIRTFIAGIAAAAMGLLSSCHPFIFDDEGDCSVHYRVPFTYTMNILDADAFASQVKSVTLYVFDSAGKLALVKTESGAALAQPGYAMDVELLPGKYSMLAWAEGEAADPSGAVSFEIGGGSQPASITALDATLPLSGAAPDQYSDRDIVPLFHGYASSVDLPDTYGTVTLPAIDLTKDTNLINVSLQNTDGTELKTVDFDVRIEADNSHMAWDNALQGATPFAYCPWSETAFATESGARAEENVVTSYLAELTTGRLMLARRPMLSIVRTSDGMEIIRINLLQYLCMVKGHYGGAYSDQEYLDRMDFFSMTFFVTDDLNWYVAMGVNINGWRVVPPADIEL